MAAAELRGVLLRAGVEKEQAELIDDETVGPFCWSVAEDAAATEGPDGAFAALCDVLSGYIADPLSDCAELRQLVNDHLTLCPAATAAEPSVISKSVPATEPATTTSQEVVSNMKTTRNQTTNRATKSSDDPDVAVLADMFPNLSLDELRRARRSCASLDEAVSKVLETMADSIAALAVPLGAPAPTETPRASSSSKVVRLPSSAPKESDDDMEKIKQTIIQGYMLQEVPLNEDRRVTRPTLPKALESETKFKTRYLDGTIVSTRGERYIVEKDEEEKAALKHTYVNLKPLRQYRFH